MIQVKVVARPESVSQELYLPAVVKGLGVTMKRFFENLLGKTNEYGRRGQVVTLQYPEEFKPYPARNRGLHHLTKRDDGSVRCVACMCCPTACPAHCITIVAEETGNGSEKRPRIFEIDELRCVVCGLCVEACPCDAIRMDTGTHAKPVTDRADAVLGKIDLMNLTKTVSTAHQGGLGGGWRLEQPATRNTVAPNKPDLTPVSPVHLYKPAPDAAPVEEPEPVAAAAAGGTE